MTSAAVTRGPRVGRAAAATGLGVLVALAAHLAGGGTAPPVGAVLVVAVLLQPVAVLLAGRRHRLWRQALLVALGQAGAHLLLTLGPAVPTTPGASPAAMSHAMPGMVHATALPALVVHAHPGGAMLGWHVLAWALTTASWRWGTVALRRVASTLGRALARLRPLPLPGTAAPATPGAVHLRVPAAPLPQLAATPRRGPPLPA